MFRQIGAPEIILILAVVVLLFGAKKLPELARGSGRALRIFKAETKGLLDDEDEKKTDPQAIAPAAAPVSPAQTGPAQTGPAQTGPAQTGPAQTTPLEATPSEVGPTDAEHRTDTAG